MKTTSLKKSIVSVLTGQVATYALTLIQIPYLTHRLSPDGFGVFSFASLLILIGLNFVLYGVDNSGVYLFRKFFHSPYRRSLVFWNQFAAQIILGTIAAILLCASLLVSDQLRAHSDAYIVVAISFLVNALYNPWIFAATERFQVLSTIYVLLRAGSLLMILLTVHGPGDVLPAVIALVVPNIPVTIAFFIWIFRSGFIQRVPIRMMNPMLVLRRDKYIAGSAYVALIHNYIGMVVAKFVLSGHDYGLLSFADRFRWITFAAVSLVGNVLFSRYCGERVASLERGAAFGWKAATALAGFGGAVALVMIVLAHPLTSLLGGKNFLPAEPLVMLVAVALPFIGLNYYLTAFIINVFHLASRQVVILSAVAATIFATIYLIPSPTAFEVLSIIVGGEVLRAVLALVIIRVGGYRVFHPGLRTGETLVKKAA